MGDDPSLRRSTRSRRQNPRYSEPFHVEVDSQASSSSSSSASDVSEELGHDGSRNVTRKRKRRQRRRRRSGGDLGEKDGDSGEDNGDDDDKGATNGDPDILGNDNSDVGSGSGSGTCSDGATYHDDEEDGMDIDEPNQQRQRQNKVAKRRGRTVKTKINTNQASTGIASKKSAEVKKPSCSSTVRMRGITTLHRHGSKAQKIRSVFGSDPVDIEAAIAIRDKWLWESCLPSRLPDRNGFGGMSYSAHYTDEMRLEEKRRAWKWYSDGRTRGVFSRGQPFKNLTQEDAAKYLHANEPSDYTFLAGPLKHMRPVSIPKGHAISVRETVSHACAGSNDPIEAGQQADGVARGWYIYMGDRINCLEWAPNKQHAIQYLAVSTLNNEQLGGQQQPDPNIDHQNTSFAFVPSASTPAAICIWAFKGKEHFDDSATFTINEDKASSLELVLCTDWGPVKELKWCPVPQPVNKGKSSEAEVNLGFLAGLWGDGTVRVIEVKYNNARRCLSDEETNYLKISKPLFTSKPPNSVCSCVTWLSSSDVAVGCSNGYVAIWNIECAAESISQPDHQLPVENYRPWFYKPLHSTYISAIHSGYPSRPYLLTTTSMDGYVRLTDVRSPMTDHVLSFRTRLGVYSLAWVDAAQAFYAPDETSLVRAFPLRQFYASLALCRVSASVTALATSPIHPFILITSTDGAVTVANSLPRIYEGRNPVWQVIWLLHEWRPSLNEMRKKEQGGDGKKSSIKNSFWKKLMSDGKDVSENEEDDGQHHDIEHSATTPIDNDDIDNAAITVNATSSSTPPTDADKSLPVKRNSIVADDKPLGRILEGFKPTKAGKKQLRDDEATKSGNQSYTPLLVIYETRTAATAIAWNPNLSCGGWAAAGFASGLVRVEDLAI